MVVPTCSFARAQWLVWISPVLSIFDYSMYPAYSVMEAGRPEELSGDVSRRFPRYPGRERSCRTIATMRSCRARQVSERSFEGRYGGGAHTSIWKISVDSNHRAMLGGLYHVDMRRRQLWWVEGRKNDPTQRHANSPTPVT